MRMSDFIIAFGLGGGGLAVGLGAFVMTVRPDIQELRLGRALCIGGCVIFAIVAVTFGATSPNAIGYTVIVGLAGAGIGSLTFVLLAWANYKIRGAATDSPPDTK